MLFTYHLRFETWLWYSNTTTIYMQWMRLSGSNDLCWCLPAWFTGMNKILSVPKHFSSTCTVSIDFLAAVCTMLGHTEHWGRKQGFYCMFEIYILMSLDGVVACPELLTIWGGKPNSCKNNMIEKQEKAKVEKCGKVPSVVCWKYLLSLCFRKGWSYWF